jgi:AGZA family xanthine/uracil permease-like MFS transporter
MPNLLDRVFRLRAHGTSVRTEILGGTTTFAAMAYIIVVNPAILNAAGLDLGPSTMATILAAVFGSLLMGLYANRPLAVAPYMGENAFIAFSIVALMGLSWQLALGAVFVSGVAFLIVTLLGIRTWLAQSISTSLKHSFAVGIGLFLSFIGLFQSGIVMKPSAPNLPVQIGDLRDPKVLLALGGFVLILVLQIWRFKGAILLSMTLVAAAGYALGIAEAPRGIVALPFVGDYDIRPVALKLDIVGIFEVRHLPVLLTLLLMSFLDTLGSLLAVGAAGNLLDKDGNLPELEKPMLVDSLACCFAAAVGTSTSGAYIESAAGVREGARTGLAAVTTGLLFAAALFFIPLVQPLQNLQYAYGPALVAVGVMMLSSVRHIDFDDLTELAPAFVTILLVVFTFNIGNGLTAGLVLHPFLKLVAGRAREIRVGGLVLAAASLVYYVFGLVH